MVIRRSPLVSAGPHLASATHSVRTTPIRLEDYLGVIARPERRVACLGTPQTMPILGPADLVASEVIKTRVLVVYLVPQITIPKVSHQGSEAQASVAGMPTTLRQPLVASDKPNQRGHSLAPAIITPLPAASVPVDRASAIIRTIRPARQPSEVALVVYSGAARMSIRRISQPAASAPTLERAHCSARIIPTRLSRSRAPYSARHPALHLEVFSEVSPMPINRRTTSRAVAAYSVDLEAHPILRTLAEVRSLVAWERSPHRTPVRTPTACLAPQIPAEGGSSVITARIKRSPVRGVDSSAIQRSRRSPAVYSVA